MKKAKMRFHFKFSKKNEAVSTSVLVFYEGALAAATVATGSQRI